MYPVYRWSFEIEHDYSTDKINANIMFRTKPTEEELNDFLQDAFNEAILGKDRFTCRIPDDTKEDGYRFEYRKAEELNIHILDADIWYVGDDEWCLTWFSHYTFDIGQTDEEALASFKKFVEDFESGKKRTFGTLMGAEDRWRWCGHVYPDGENAAPVQVKAPCRCQFCKAQGKIRINH